nr:hypothetical protein [Tanacetum cinerariifolium]
DEDSSLPSHISSVIFCATSGGTYLLTVGTHGALYELFTGDDLKKGLKGGLIEFACGLGPEDLNGGLI